MTMDRVFLPAISFQEGPLADRPTADPTNFWLVWYATDTEALSVSDGTIWIAMGGGGGSFSDQRESVDQNQDAPALSQTQLAWATAGGATLLDYTDPTTPTVIAAGLYLFNMSVLIASGPYPGEFAEFFLSLDNGAATPLYLPTTFPMDSAIANAQMGISMTAYLPAGAQLVALFQHSDAGTVNVEFFGYVQQIIAA